MGKNQAYKAMQRAKMSTQTAAGGVEEVEDGMISPPLAFLLEIMVNLSKYNQNVRIFLMDGSFHSPEWHAARLASLQTSHTITWEEFKRRQKDEAKRKEEEEDGEVRLMKEYRAQLDAERARKLARGINHTEKKLASKGKKDKDKERKKKKSKRKRKDMSANELGLDSSTEEEKHKSRRKKEKSGKRDKKDRGYTSQKKRSGSSSGTSSEEEYGPVPLSSYFECKP